jgi:hypothetical protein
MQVIFWTMRGGKIGGRSHQLRSHAHVEPWAWHPAIFWADLIGYNAKHAPTISSMDNPVCFDAGNLSHAHTGRVEYLLGA